VVPEAELEQTEAGLVPASWGWFVMNARDARWFHRPGRGDSLPVDGIRRVRGHGPRGFYCADETAARYNASSPEDTQDGEVAYARFPPSQPSRHRDGLLPT
jgi:hypothetical protein